MMDTVTRGDIIVYEMKKTFPRKRVKECTAVVEQVEPDHVICGIDGRINKSKIVKIKGKSPEYNEKRINLIRPYD